MTESAGATMVKPKREQPLPRRERERLSRQLEIVDAACDVFAEKGFERATLDEIAERAEYGKGTLYNYFKNKEDLFAASMQRVFDLFREFAINACSQELTVRGCFTEYVRQAVAYYREHYALCHMVMMEFLRLEREGGGDQKERHLARLNAVIEPLARRLQRGMRDGEIRRGDVRSITMIFLGVVHHYYLHLTREQLPMTDREMRRQVDLVLSVFFDGIAVPAPKFPAEGRGR